MITLPSMLGFLRRRVEGLVFLLLFPVFLAGLILVGCRSGLQASRVKIWARRWQNRMLHGLRDIRAAWWLQCKLERASDVWWYIIGLEVAELVNLPASGGSAVPLAERASILVLKYGHFGDTLHMVPMLKALRNQRPACRIELVLGPWSTALGAKIAYADAVLEHTPRFAMYHRGKRGSINSLLREWRFFSSRRGKIDWVFCTSSISLPELFFIAAVGARAWAGPAAPVTGYAVLDAGRTVPYDARAYDAERVMDLLPLVGLERGPVVLEYPISSACVAHGEKQWAGAGHPRVVVAPGAGWPGRQWPPDRFAAVCDGLIEKLDASILLVGAPGETGLGREVQSAMRHPVIDRIGQTSIDELAGILRQADLFLGNDSGPMHLAAALDVPSVSLFGVGVASRWAPRGEHHAALQHAHDCSGCIGWHPRGKCLHDGACMKLITVSEVLAAADKLLSAVKHTDR